MKICLAYNVSGFVACIEKHILYHKSKRDSQSLISASETARKGKEERSVLTRIWNDSRHEVIAVVVLWSVESESSGKVQVRGYDRSCGRAAIAVHVVQFIDLLSVFVSRRGSSYCHRKPLLFASLKSIDHAHTRYVDDFLKRSQTKINSLSTKLVTSWYQGFVIFKMCLPFDRCWQIR